jgi:hypothetical protein
VIQQELVDRELPVIGPADVLGFGKQSFPCALREMSSRIDIGMDT